MLIGAGGFTPRTAEATLDAGHCDVRACACAACVRACVRYCNDLYGARGAAEAAAKFVCVALLRVLNRAWEGVVKKYGDAVSLQAL